VTRRRPTEERGGATVLAVTCLGLLLLVGAALGVVAAMVAAHRQAQAAADLAALAGATTIGDGGDPCAAASGVATANRATLLACTVEGSDVHVEVRVTGPRWLGQTGDLTAQARAGPVAAPVAGW
jgi:secretion/DNA translocation related TadE-like protein